MGIPRSRRSSLLLQILFFCQFFALVVQIVYAGSHDCVVPASDAGLRNLVNRANEVTELACKNGLQLDLGPTLEPSCLTGNVLENVRRLELLLNYSAEQLNRCRQVYPLLVGIDEAILHLKSMKISCKMTALGFAASESVKECGNWLGGLFGKKSYCTNKSLNDFKMELDLQSLYQMPGGEGGRMKPIDPSGAQRLVQAMAHESLHHSPVNNRSWHNQAHLHRIRGCSPSVFEDRVYLIGALCFPLAEEHGFLDPDEGAISCKGVCERALTQVDDAMPDSYRRAEGMELLIARPMQQKQAADLCSSVRSNISSYRNLVKRRDELERPLGKRSHAIAYLRDTSELAPLYSLFKEFQTAALKIYAPEENFNSAKNVALVRLKSFQSELLKACANIKGSSSTVSFCQSYKDFMIEETNSIAVDFKRIDPKNLILFRSINLSPVGGGASL